MRGVAGVPLLLAAFVVHSVVSVRPPSTALFSTPMVEGYADFSLGQRGALFSASQETARESREEDVSEDDEQPQKIFSNFFLGHHDSPLPRELLTVARLPATDPGATRSYDGNYLLEEGLRGKLAHDPFEEAHAHPAKAQELAREPTLSFYDRIYSESFPVLFSEGQTRGTSGDFGRGRFRRSSDESKLIKKKIRSHFRVESTLGDHKPEMSDKENSASAFANQHNDVSNTSGELRVQERSFKEKSGNDYHSGEDSEQQSSNYRYGPIGLRHDEDDRPNYYFQESADVYDGTNEHHGRKSGNKFSSIHPEETGFHKFSFYESVDDFNKDFIATHPQNSQGPSDHLRSPYTHSKFKNAVDHKPPVKTQKYSEHGDSGVNMNHESYSFSDPHPTDIVTQSPYSPYTSSDTNNKQKIHYDDKERTKDPHVTYLENSPYVTDRHPSGKGKAYDGSGDKENYYHSDESTIYSPQKSIYNENTVASPHHEYFGGNNHGADNHNYRGSGDYDDRHSGSGHDYHQDDYDGRHSFRGENSHASYSGDDHRGHRNAVSHQRYNNDDHKGIGYEDGHHGPHGSHGSRFPSDDHPYSKRTSETTSSHPSHSVDAPGGHSHSGSSHSAQNIHPSNFDRSPFQPSHELSSEHSHSRGFAFYESNAGGRAQDHHKVVIEDSHNPAHFTPGVSAPLNDGGDFFHVEENIADLPEFLGTGSHETDAHKFRHNENFVPNDVVSFNPLQLTESYLRSPYTPEKHHSASYREEKPIELYENSLYSSDPSTFERVRLHNSNKPVNGKYQRTQQHARGQGIRASLRSNPSHLNRSVRPRARPPHALPSSPRGTGPPMGSSLMQFLHNLPAVNWSGRPTYRTVPNRFYR